jgi:exopolysaccharide biosynthesis polyprenyl glycosylphosphotransferase
VVQGTHEQRSARGDGAETTVLQRRTDGTPERALRLTRPPEPQAAPLAEGLRSPWREPRWLRYGVSPYLLVGDVLAFAAATALATTMSTHHLLLLVLDVAVFAAAGLYRSRLSLRLLDDLPYIAAAVAVGFTLNVTLAVFFPGMDSPRQQLVHFAALLATVSAVRCLAYLVVRTARRRGLVRHRTVILGAGEVGTHLALTLLERREYGLDPVGFVDAAPAPVDPSDEALLPLPVLGHHDQLEQLLHQHAIRDVIVAFGSGADSEIVDVLTTCDRIDIDVFLVPRLLELHNVARDTDEIWGVPVVRRRRATYRSPWWRVKRLLDVVAASGAVVALAPVLALCALAVRLEGGPGVIFRQQRIGLDGRTFQILKFRTLRPVDERESQTNWSIRHDDRLGRVGRFLRASSLDELPQLWNVVRGDMSLVGPRPERQHFVDQFSTHIPRYKARHRVPAGLTGWSQVHGLRGDTSIHDRARFDNYYIENWSLWLDLKILLMTVNQVVRRQGG